MSRVRLYYVPETREFVTAENRPRPDGVHNVIQDSCEPFVSHLDGKTYDSKSEYRRTLKAAGMVELGNDQIKPRPRDEDRSLERDIAQAMKDHWR